MSDRRPLAGRELHMMGVGGAGVSALAMLAAGWGAAVSGCDRAASSYSRRVEDAGIDVAIGHDAAHVHAGCELVVSSAVPAGHPEVERARELGVRVLLRGELLGELTRLARSVVVAGAHGKTTTTAMAVHALLAAGVDVSTAIGGELPGLGGNVRVGTPGGWLVAEGDESDRTLLHLAAQVAIVTNVERDHHHTFASDDEVEQLFATWVGSLGAGSTLVAGPGPVLDRLAAAAPGRVVRFGEDADELEAISDRLAVPGLHNALNALAAVEACVLLGVEREAALASLASFHGVGRRFEVVGEAAGVLVVDDYAHHPTEVAATIQAARRHQAARAHAGGVDAGGSVVVVFQPHLYSRTQALWREFAVALALADRVLLLPVYGAREEPLAGVTSALVGDEVARIAPDRWGGVVEIDAATGDVTTIADCVGRGDMVITMGAGSVTQVAPRLVGELVRRGGIA